MRPLYNFLFITFIFLASCQWIGCENRSGHDFAVDLTSPQATVKTVINATYFKNTKAYLDCFSHKFFENLNNPHIFDKENLESSFRKAKKLISPDEYQVTSVTYDRSYARVEYELTNEKAVTDTAKAAYILEKQNNDWKVIGMDRLLKGSSEWSYTAKEDRFKMLKKI